MLSRIFHLESTFATCISKVESKFRLLEREFRDVEASKLDHEQKNEMLDRLDRKLKEVETRLERIRRIRGDVVNSQRKRYDEFWGLKEGWEGRHRWIREYGVPNW
jgi:hypothetical protein